MHGEQALRGTSLMRKMQRYHEDFREPSSQEKQSKVLLVVVTKMGINDSKMQMAEMEFNGGGLSWLLA
jgi:hypothetical protein